MPKIYFDNRDELVAINTETVAAVLASGNYCRVLTLNGRETTLTHTLTVMEKSLTAHKSPKAKFIRLGRSLMVNHAFLSRIDLLKQVVVLSDGVNDLKIKAPKETLKAYKKAVAQSIQIKNHAKDHLRNGGQPAL